MGDHHNHTQETIWAYFQDQFLPVVCGKLDYLEDLVEKVHEIIEKYYQNLDKAAKSGDQWNNLSYVRTTRALKSDILAAVAATPDPEEMADFDQDFKNFIEQINQFIESQETLVTEVQDSARFRAQPDDRFWIKMAKRVKNLLFYLFIWPRNLINFFRRLVRKPNKYGQQWQRRVPLQGLQAFYLRDQMAAAMMPLLEQVYAKIASSSESLWYLDEKIDRQFIEVIHTSEIDKATASPSPIDFSTTTETVLSDVAVLKTEMKKGSKEIFDVTFQSYLEAYQKVGTLELPEKRFNLDRVKRKHEALRQRYQRLSLGWHNTFFVQDEHYNLDQELYQLRYGTLEQYYLLDQKLGKKIKQKINDQLLEVFKFLNQVNANLEDFSGNRDALSEFIQQQKYDCFKNLKTRLVPQAIKALLDQNLPAQIDNIEVRVKNHVAQLSEKRAVVKNLQLDQPTKTSDIDYFSPQELIAFETLPDFLSVTKKLKSELVHQIDEIQKNLMDLEQITDFNLASALASLEDEESEEDPLTIGKEGIERAATRIDDIKEELKEMHKEVVAAISDSITAFNEGIFALTKTDTVFDIKLRVAKAKTIEKTKALQTRVTDYLQITVPRMVSKAKRKLFILNRYYLETRKKYGISTQTVNLSAEVSTFLSDTEASIKQLPFVYQRLFEIVPLENENFYVARQAESLQITKAFQNWQKSYFSPTVLVGEAGSGTTTLVNFWLAEQKTNCNLVNANATEQIYKETALLGFFRDLFKHPELESFEALADLLNSFKVKQIIVLENLQHFYLRKVDGFDCFKKMFWLISQTNKNVFWLATINLYAYEYLNKTLSIEDFFAYTIRLRALKDEQITSVILKRHSVSGYNVQYKPGKIDRKSKKFIKAKPKAQQAFLEKEYFAGLNRLANSNISVALIYWLRSTLQVTDDSLVMGSLKDFDFSFLSNLNQSKLFTLHMLLLHDGLTTENHSLVFNQSIEKSKLDLILLHEDGILIKRDEFYFLNPLLFRQVVNLLKAKNLLH